MGLVAPTTRPVTRKDAGRYRQGEILPTANAPRFSYTPKPLNCQELQPEPIPKHIVRIKSRAFTANRQAKASTGHVRAAHYREKDAAMNALLKTEFAFINEVDWYGYDPVVSVSFAGGGRLHIKLSCLDREGLRTLRAYSNDGDARNYDRTTERTSVQ